MKLKYTSVAGFTLSLFFLTGLFAFASVTAFAQERNEKPNRKFARRAEIAAAQARGTRKTHLFV
jgi:hypothetical protein